MAISKLDRTPAIYCRLSKFFTKKLSTSTLDLCQKSSTQRHRHMEGSTAEDTISARGPSPPLYTFRKAAVKRCRSVSQRDLNRPRAGFVTDIAPPLTGVPLPAMQARRQLVDRQGRIMGTGPRFPWRNEHQRNRRPDRPGGDPAGRPRGRQPSPEAEPSSLMPARVNADIVNHSSPLRQAAR